MDVRESVSELKKLLSRVNPPELPKLLHWIQHSGELDELLLDNRKVMLQSIADDLRALLPLDAMLPGEAAAHHKMQRRPRPTVHVDAFLYDDDQVDALCEGGAMSRNYCLHCGSQRTAPLDFVSHSFSVSELHFLFQNVLPDLSGRTLVDVGSRLGAVLYGVVQADICTQVTLLQNADVLIMNNVFEYFMEPKEQVKAWRFIIQNFIKPSSLLVTVPSLQETLRDLQQEALPPGWVEELPVDYGVYVGGDTDPDALRQIHLYKVM
ncbi:uncharacterized protein zgc:109986 isoform X3 [Solea solea]|uniref:uncharacterized protein zgc:109986 isoform X3 n=1 Tax=Solea solea TaxID=90069 RepID=UPI00272C4895|nr:uncharacterized protein zgc:109986 isoform X3 [Solea solea]